MRIGIVGTGAVGGLVGAGFALAGEELTFVDVGRQLEAIRLHGVHVVMQGGEDRLVQPARAVEDVREAGEQDLVVLALKAHDIASVAEDLPAMFGAETPLLHIQNGLPWWYFQRHGGTYEGRRIQALDPAGVISTAIDPRRILGCVPFPAARVERPGVIRHVEGNRFPVGELDGRTTGRAEMVVDLFTRAGFKSFVIGDIRAEIWLKLWGNLSFNPISALTHATMEEIAKLPSTRDLLAELMTEAQTVAHALGITFRVSLEKRIAGAEKVGPHRTSTLQDVEAGRRLEVEALLGAAIELGDLVGVPTPYMDTLYACTRLLDETMGRHGARVRASPLEPS